MLRYRRANVAAVLLALFGALVLVALVVGGCAFMGYNKAIRLDEAVDAEWAQVENVLQRRYELIPNLVETVKGFADQEKEIFTTIAESRTKYFAADRRGEQIEAAAGVERALSRLLMLKETYPQLNSQASFLKLQDELAGTENRIAVERKRYNDAVRALNSYCRGMPGSLFCNLASVEAEDYFELTDEAARDAPKVDFSSGAGAPQAQD